MTIVNQRWPREICPQSCAFERSRNDIAQQSPRTRQRSIIRTGGRPLWSAQCSWLLPNGAKLAKLRYWLEALDGFSGSVQVWDFASPYPFGLNLATSDTEMSRIFWSYLSTRAPFSFAGMPSFWALDSYLTLGAAVAAGATSIPLSGLTPSGLVCVQGQYIQIGRRLYLCADGATADGSGNATVTILPALIDAAPIGTEVRFAEAACEMQLAEQSFGASASAGEGFISVSATFVESVTDVT